MGKLLSSYAGSKVGSAVGGLPGEVIGLKAGEMASSLAGNPEYKLGLYKKLLAQKKGIISSLVGSATSGAGKGVEKVGSAIKSLPALLDAIRGR